MLSDRILGFIGIALIVGYATTAVAADGDFDPGFGQNGRTTVNWVPGDAQPSAVAIDSVGRIVITGQAQPYDGVTEFMLLRLDTRGNLDTGFASSQGGFFQYDFDLNGVGGFGGNSANTVVVQPDGHIVAAGCANIGVAQTHFAALRVDDSGQLDPGFGNAGTLHFGAPFAQMNCVQTAQLDSEGRLMLAGYTAHPLAVNNTNQFQYYAATARLTASGQLDTSFNSGAVSELTYVQNAQSNFGVALGIDSSGRVYVSGETDTPDYSEGAVLRLRSDGAVDMGFGTIGRQLLGSNYYQITALYVLPSGVTMLAGSAINSTNQLIVFLARLLADGTLDPAFANSGIAEFPLSNAGFVGLVAPTKRDGWLVEAADNQFGILLIRTDSQGNLDATFGANGVAHAVFDPSYNSLFIASRPALESNGELVVAGYVPEAAADGDFDFGVMRILADYDTIFVNGFQSKP